MASKLERELDLGFASDLHAALLSLCESRVCLNELCCGAGGFRDVRAHGFVALVGLGRCTTRLLHQRL